MSKRPRASTSKRPRASVSKRPRAPVSKRPGASVVDAQIRLVAALDKIEIRSPVEFAFAGEKPVDARTQQQPSSWADRQRRAKTCWRGVSRRPSMTVAMPSGTALTARRRMPRSQRGSEPPTPGANAGTVAGSFISLGPTARRSSARATANARPCRELSFSTARPAWRRRSDRKSAFVLPARRSRRSRAITSPLARRSTSSPTS